MNSKLENRISMYYKVAEFFSNHLTTLEATAPALTSNIANFNTQVSELDALIIIADENTSGYATRKQNNRTAMQTSGLSISGALNAAALLNNDPTLAAKAYATATSLNGKRDTDVLYFCERLKTMADNNAAALAPMGIDAAKIAAFEATITSFKNVIQEPADKRSEGKSAFVEADEKASKIGDTLLITDAVMLAISEEHSLLYGQYRANRLIDDNASGQSNPDIIEIIEAATTEILYEVPYLESRSFKLNNPSSESLRWALSEDGENPIEEWQSVPAGASSTRQSSTLGINGSSLIVNNPGATNAQVELSVIE